MKLEDHVIRAIDLFQENKKEEALLHACIAIDSTSQKLFQKSKSGRKEYKRCIRNYWWLIERFIGDGLNLEETRWTNLSIEDGNGSVIQDPDLADVIYHIFRCNHVHGKDVPQNFSLLPTEDGRYSWVIERGKSSAVKMPESIVWALLAVIVFSKANSGVKSNGDYYLTWGSKTLGIGPEKFIIKDWWGREEDVRLLLSKYKQIRVKLDGL